MSDKKKKFISDRQVEKMMKMPGPKFKKKSL